MCEPGTPGVTHLGRVLGSGSAYDLGQQGLALTETVTQSLTEE